ncbi:coiled-coil domain-containing protein [Abyssisolibacter fermentans]|uniref:coiled-coil domain-containing protein n=1 Tax=Abyssisolibacter fermentans TaxID=1766203 RepID=UPI00083739C6|nr:hypothetical protein [Abyssisolibacter fermentans]
MKQKFSLILVIIIVFTILFGCSNQTSIDTVKKLEENNKTISDLQKQLDKTNDDIENLSEEITALKNEIQNNKYTAINFKNNTRYYEDGKIIIVLDFPEADSSLYKVGFATNSYYIFDILIVNEKQEVTMYSPEVESIKVPEGERYKLVFPEVDYEKMIVRIYESTTGKVAETHWENISDI